MNKKGVTLTEIIISIVLISIVLIFLFSLLVTVNDINYESEVNSIYLINKSLILKNIEEDFDKANEITVTECDSSTPGPLPINELYNNYGEGYDYFPSDSFKANKCLKFNYDWKSGVTVSDETENSGLLGIYYYKNKKSYVISYIRGNTKATRILPEFEKVQNNLNMDWKHNGNTISNVELDGGFHNIYIPIIGTDGKDYSLNISYYKP